MARATKRSPVTILPTPAPTGADGPASLAALLARLDQRLRTTPTVFQSLPTGFEPLDETLGGGLRPGDLVLIAGGQGTGKTTLALQIARNLASTNTARGLFVSFEHDENELVLRLLAMEGWLADQEAALSLRDLQQLLAAAGRRGQPLPTLAKDRPALAVALERLAACHERLFLTKGGSQTTTVAVIADLLERVLAATAGPVVLFIDYLQKIPAEGAFASEAERIGRVAEALKDLALSRAVPVVAVAALDSEGLRAPRGAVYHLRGSATLAYEADTVLMLAEKADCVARMVLEFQPQKRLVFRDWTVVSLVKHRGGRAGVDMEFRKRFAWSCFDPTGRFVSEPLVDERLYRE